MTRRQLAARLAEKTGLSARDAAQVLQQLPALMAEELARTRRLEWRALGTFAIKQHPARRIHIPATGQTVQLPARAGVAFKPSRKLLARLIPPKSGRRRASPPTTRRARSSASRNSSLEPVGQPLSESPSERREQVPAVTSKSLKVRLHLNVQNDNRWGRGRKRAKEDIEYYCLRLYDYRKLDKDGVEYELTVPYQDDGDLDRRIESLIREISNAAADRRCNVELDVWSVDNPDRYWA